MAEQDPNLPQVTDPATVADLIRLLKIRGALGVLNVADIVLPTVSLGSLVTPTVEVLQPSFRSTDVFSAGVQVAAPSNTVHADTGQLPVGTFNLLINGPISESSGALRWELQHRNATNTANLMIWSFLVVGSATEMVMQTVSLGYDVAAGERLRILNVDAMAAGKKSVATIFARIR